VNFISPVITTGIRSETGARLHCLIRWDPWLITRTAEQQRLDSAAVCGKGKHRLSDYGYEGSTRALSSGTGIRTQLSARPANGHVPSLIWAECVLRWDLVSSRNNIGITSLISAGGRDDWLILENWFSAAYDGEGTKSAGLIAAECSKSFLSEHGAAVIENH